MAPATAVAATDDGNDSDHDGTGTEMAAFMLGQTSPVAAIDNDDDDTEMVDEIWEETDQPDQAEVVPPVVEPDLASEPALDKTFVYDTSGTPADCVDQGLARLAEIRLAVLRRAGVAVA